MAVQQFKLGAVTLIKHRGVSAALASRDFDVHENVPRRWMRESAADAQQTFPDKGVMKPERAEAERPTRESAKLMMESDILKKAAAYFANESI